MLNYGHGVALDAVNDFDCFEMRLWRNNPAIWKWCRQHDLISVDDQKDWYERQRKDPSIHMYTIKRDGKFVGVCGFTSHDRINRTAELSMYIAPGEHGKGLASMAFKTLMDHGFRYFGLHSVWAECFEGNAVIGTLEKLGFKRDGIKREAYFRDGKFINAELLSITEAEWKQLYSPLPH